MKRKTFIKKLIIIISILLTIIFALQNNVKAVSIDEDFVTNMFYEYFLNMNQEAGTEDPEGTSQITANSYRDQGYSESIAEKYNDYYTESTIEDDYERSIEALRQAVSSIPALTETADNIVAVVEDDIQTLVDGDNASNSETGGTTSTETPGTGTDTTDTDTTTDDEGGGGFGAAINGIVGFVFWVVKLLPLLLAWLIMHFLNISLDQILFNEVPILGINFFQKVSSSVDNYDIINAIREQISVWYVAIRNIAAVILAVMVLYVGIRMAISSVAEDKARYKKMLTDWVVSLVLLFVLHYIMILIININDGLVEVLKVARDNSISEDTIMAEAFDKAMWGSVYFTTQLAYTIIYFMLVVMTFIFFCSYVKRMVTIAFLVMISPLITVTYSLDRMGDGKSQALNTWFKNFVYNILLQPFHCIIYLALVQTAVKEMTIDDVASIVVTIIMVFFMYEAEEIIKDIFHFQGKSVAKTVAQAALVTTAIGAVSKAASSGSSKVKGYASRGTPATNGNATKNVKPNTQQNDNNVFEDNKGTNTSQQSAPRGEEDNKTPIYTEGQSANNAENNYNTKNDEMWKKALKLAGGVVLGAGKGMAKITGGVILGSAGLATGNLTHAITGFKSGYGMVDNTIAKAGEQSNLRKFAKNYNNLSNIYDGHDDNWIRDHTKALLNGDEAVKPYEEDYYNMIRDEQDRYINSGMSPDDATTQIEQNVAGVQKGYISETFIKRRFKGNIHKNKKGNNRFSGN